MRKYLFLLLAIPFVFVGCKKKAEQEVATSELVGEATTLSATGISESYIIPIANSESDSLRVTNISFNISNNTGSDYADYVITPVFKDGDVVLSEVDGLTYTVNKNDTLLNGGTDNVVISVVYNGSERENVELSFVVLSGDKEEVLEVTSKISFYTYLQAFLYNSDGSALIITADTQITANPENPLKIIFVNALSSETSTTPLAVKFAGNAEGTGTVAFPSDNIILNDNSVVVCEENGNDEATFIVTNPCYVELTATASDVWSYVAVNGEGQQASSINITVEGTAVASEGEVAPAESEAVAE